MSFSEFKWFRTGDLNALFTLFLDNILNLVILASILIFGFEFPKKIVYEYMIPGTAIGVMFGDLVYAWMGYRLAKKENRSDVTAMPLGLDTPSTIGMAVFVLGPAFIFFKQSLAPEFAGEQLLWEAGMRTWYTGMAVMLWMGLVKVITSFMGSTIQRVVPAAGLLGSIAGIGLVYLAADQFITTMEFPLAGLTALALVLYSLVAGHKLPWNLPGAAMAVILGLLVYYVSAFVGIFGQNLDHFHFDAISVAMPSANLHWVPYFTKEAFTYLPIALPFGLLTVIGGINVTESARLSGDDFKTRDILLTEAVSTILAGLTGGVSQSTPYIGHSAYKKMGAGVGYTIATGVLVGVGAMLGLVGFIVQLIPHTVVAPILIFIGFEITSMAYLMTPAKHNMAVSIAIIPSVIHFGYTKLRLLMEPVQRFTQEAAGVLKQVQAAQLDATLSMKLSALLAAAGSLIPGPVAEEYPYLQAMAQGFIITGMIWGAATAYLINREDHKVIFTLMIGAILSLFGIIHSATPSGQIYFPWELKDPLYIPYKFASAYAFSAVLLYFLGRFAESKDAAGKNA